ncbi:MAG: segregation/condensation protein A [Parachlamydiaceae bacterium]|nr:segregation/condensation protein A [Parachlamydiaceae bacterium]
MKTREDLIFALDNFEGPLEFLWHLIQTSEIDINEVSLKKITDQYLVQLKQVYNVLNIDAGAEFIGTTAALLLFKSRNLLPKHERQALSEDEGLDPRFDIINQLIDYCRFKEAGKLLSEREQQQSGFFSRGIEGGFEPQKPLGIEHISLNDLATLFQQVLAKAESKRGVIDDEIWIIGDKMALIRQLIKDLQRINFYTLFSAASCREELIVTFLAILELMKLGDVAVIKESEDDFYEVFIVKGNQV